MSDRARQFAPFSALKGFQQLLKEKERVIIAKKELPEDALRELSEKIMLVKKGMIIKVVHFCQGEYIATEGMVTGIDLTFRSLTVVKTKIYFDNILEISL